MGIKNIWAQIPALPLTLLEVDSTLEPGGIWQAVPRV